MSDRMRLHSTASEPKPGTPTNSLGQLSGYSFVSVQSEDAKMGFSGRTRSRQARSAAHNDPLAVLDKPAAHSKVAAPIQEFYQRIRQEASSKVKDGLMPPVVLLLLTLLYNLLVMPIEHTLQLPGMFVFVLVVLAIAAIALERCLQLRFGQADRAFQGMLAGMLFWFSADLAARLGGLDITDQSVVVFMLLVSLLTTVLWRSVFPIGLKFFSMVFLLNWVGGFLFSKLIALLEVLNFSGQSHLLYMWITLTCILLLALWLFLRSTSRIQRYWVAIGLWFLGLQTIALYWGWII